MMAPEWDGDSIDGRPTIFSHALALSAMHGSGPWPDDGHPLPDETPADGDDPVLTSVVRDGVMSHHFAPPKVTDEEVRAIADQFAAHARLGPPRPPRAQDLVELHELLASRPAISVADRLIAELRTRGLPPDRLRRIARMLAMAGSRREAVKAGIAVLGVCGDERDRDLLVLLGALDELTLFAVVAITTTQPDRERTVYEVARRVEGWGRIHAVERLTGSTDPEIRAWLLRGGFRSGVMDEYLAYIAAMTGHLHEALLDPAPDQELLTGAGGILAALSDLDGPAKDMRHYPDAVPAMHRFAELAGQCEPTLELLDSLLTLGRFVAHTPDFDWPDGEPERLSARYAELLARPAWAETALIGLAQPVDRSGFDRALWCADRLGIPVLEHALRHLNDNPDNAYVWQTAMQQADDGTIGRVAELARTVLPVADIASGPALSHGLGRGYQYDRVLDVVVRGLAPYPGTAPDLVRAALASRVIRVRRAALGVLDRWPGDYRGWVAGAAAAEPDAELRAELEKYLA